MLPNEILPAIPRQKVRLKSAPATIATVLMIGEDGKRVAVQQGKYLCEWSTEDCEPVHEEPRPFRCGDCVVSRHGYDNSAVIGKIQAMNVTGTRFCIGGSWFDDIRFATPSEVAQYFN